MSSKAQSLQRTKAQQTKSTKPKHKTTQQHTLLNRQLKQMTLTPQTLIPPEANQLQRTIGNQSVGRFLTSKGQLPQENENHHDSAVHSSSHDVPRPAAFPGLHTNISGQAVQTKVAPASKDVFFRRNIQRKTSPIIQRVAYAFDESWDYGSYNIFSKLDFSGVAKAKQTLNDSLDNLSNLLDDLKNHNYYKHLTTFTNEEKAKAFTVLKSDIGEIANYIDQEDGSIVKWNDRTQKGKELAQKAEDAQSLLSRFADYVEDAAAQSEEEKSLLQEIKSTLTKLGGMNGKLKDYLNEETKQKRSEAMEKQKALSPDENNLVGFSEIDLLGKEVSSIEGTYTKADTKWTSDKEEREQERERETREQEELERQKREKELEEEKLRAKVKVKAGNSFLSLLKKTNNDLVLLDGVLTKALEKGGKPGQLDVALNFVDITEGKSKDNFYALLDKVTLSELKNLLEAIGKNRGGILLKLLNTKSVGSSDTLAELIENTEDEDFTELDSLLSDLEGNANTALGLLNKKGKPGDVRKVLSHTEVGDNAGKAQELLENKGSATDTHELLAGGVPFDDAKALLKLASVEKNGSATAFIYKKSGDDLEKTKFVIEHGKYPATIKGWIDKGHTFAKVHEKLTACNTQKFWNGETRAEPKVIGAANVADLINKAVRLDNAGTGDFWYKHHSNYPGDETMALPNKDSHNYTEYGFEKLGEDIEDRGTKRIVKDGVGNTYYSPNHYKTFYKI